MRQYSSTDAGAPQIPAVSAAGAFLPVLKAVLVNGYGAIPSAGWSMPYTSGATIASFKQGAGGNNRFYRVWDGLAAADNYGYRHFRIRGYEVMTAISTGTGAFPTTTQVTSNGLYCPYKVENTYDAGAGALSPKWLVWADAQTAVVAIQVSANPAAPWVWMTFGQFESFKVADAYNDMVAASSVEFYAGFFGYYSTFDGMYVTRDVAGTGASIPASIAPISNTTNSSMMGLQNYAHPDPVTGATLLAKTTITTIASAGAPVETAKMRGSFRWVWDTPHNVAENFPSGTTFSGSGATAGKTFRTVGGSGIGAAIIETSNTWS